MCVYICVYVCVYVCVCVCVYVCLGVYVFMFVCECVNVCISVCVSMCDDQENEQWREWTSVARQRKEREQTRMNARNQCRNVYRHGTVWALCDVSLSLPRLLSWSSNDSFLLLCCCSCFVWLSFLLCLSYFWMLGKKSICLRRLGICSWPTTKAKRVVSLICVGPLYKSKATWL